VNDIPDWVILAGVFGFAVIIGGAAWWAMR
jgi:hypothetical protein